ncbi:CDP-glycerol glycerophosphotransferase family protein [Anaerobiospirillum thomasii]|uniref:CDP-Glycerol:Poly(Glycerophosphate) glycerophosphotransferase n=1 Tax=Anaerobiospirillum thomasii TaxID=179995 RepID=A0A2X0VAU8_9GAMM|nr:CDP-glycerol glycerophosphotransferase family protein [Anaerobiospirillum thomasii]SPT70873.1 CDP-Glycerol:Poly(glycerophosphate) glycerophosphotransferase [Anaerobiospirillum thomasii]
MSSFLIKGIESIIVRFIFKTISLFIKKNNDVVLFLYSKTSQRFSNLDTLKSYIQTNSQNLKIEVSDNNVFSTLKKIALSNVIIIDQTNRLLSRLNIENKHIVQIWHGGGEYKCVGFDAKRIQFSERSENSRINKIHGYYNYIVCSDEKLKDRYSSMFNTDKENIWCCGLPRLDIFFKYFSHANIVDLTNSNYKKVILIAPTFRSYGSDIPLIQILPIIAKIRKDCLFLYRCHPNLNVSHINGIENIIDVSSAPYASCLAAAEILVTDYSSIIFDYSFFKRPTIIYAEDLELYTSVERKLYNTPVQLVSTNVAYNILEFNKLIDNCTYADIWERFMSANTGNSSKFILDKILSLINID